MFRDYGNGDIGDDGAHDIDMARWGLPVGAVGLLGLGMNDVAGLVRLAARVCGIAQFAKLSTILVKVRNELRDGEIRYIASNPVPSAIGVHDPHVAPADGAELKERAHIRIGVVQDCVSNSD